MKTNEIIDEELRYLIVDSSDEDIDIKLDEIINSDISFLRILVSILGEDTAVEVRPNKIFYLNCLFHNTDDMPLYIDDNNKVFYCYSCGESGTIISFIYKYYGIYPKSAINILYAYLNDNLDELDNDELNVFKDIFKNYKSKVVTNYLGKSTYKTNHLNERIDNYLDNYKEPIYDLDKISRRLSCSKQIVKERIYKKSNN